MSRLSTSKELSEIGEKMGLTAKDLMDFVKETQAQERTDREAERVAKKEAAEREKEVAEYEARFHRETQAQERTDREAERVAKKEAAEREKEVAEYEARFHREKVEAETRFHREKVEVETESRRVAAVEDNKRIELDAETRRIILVEENKRMEWEYKKLLLEKNGVSEGVDEMGDNGSVHGSEHGQGGRTKPMKGPKMPKFEENTDDLDSYLYRFEKYANVQNWKKESWALYLAALLKGKALDVYSRLPPEDCTNYDVLKDALLKRFNLTEEGFKQKFRNAKQEKGEAPRQFMTRLDTYLQRWVDMTKVEKTYDGLSDLMVKEQYLDTCPRDLAVFLKERKITEVDELARVAEQYIEAHPIKQNEFKRQPEGLDSKKGNMIPGKISKELREERRYKNVCFICGKAGHLARDCRSKQRAAALEAECGEQAAALEYQHNRSPRQEKRGTGSWRGSYQNRTGNQGNRWNNGQNGYDTRTQSSSELRCRQHKRVRCSECFEIGDNGHSAQCQAMLSGRIELKCGCTYPIIADACRDSASVAKMPIAEGYVEGEKVRVLRDTGCSTVVVKRSLVSDESLTGCEETCILIDGTIRRTPVAMISIETPYLSGRVKAICMRNPLYDLIIGNVYGVKEWTENDVRVDHESQENSDNRMSDIQAENTVEHESENEIDIDSDEAETEVKQVTHAVVTRHQARVKHQDKTLKVADSVDINVTKDVLIKMQKEDQSLLPIWKKLEEQETNRSLNEKDKPYAVRKELLYRKFIHKQDEQKWQLVIPKDLRLKVLILAHESILSGHQGISRTRKRVELSFWWPGIYGDVTRFVRSCDVCQRCVAKGKPAKVPLGKLPIIDIPFQRVAIDLIGPMQPASERGHRYALTLVDYATRYPEAIPLRDEKAETVAEALVGIFSRVGVPKEILSDQGPQLMSGIMKEVSRLLSVKQLVTTPYHPMCNGLVERFNGTLKAMIVKMCDERPKDWDRYIAPLLFAYREVPQESLGYSPFELLYGRTVRGPMAILRELWTKEEIDPEVKITYQYVFDLKERLQDTCEIAHQNLKIAQGKQAKYFNRKAVSRTFKPGDKVLVLLVTNHNKLLMNWKGPFTVIERVGERDYKVQLQSRVRLLHANLLKRYFERPEQAVNQLQAAIVEPEEGEETPLDLYVTGQSETYKDVRIGEELNVDQRAQVQDLILEFRDIFTDLPKITDLGEHAIELTTDEPLRGKAYLLPHAMRDTLEKELETMMNLGIIEHSSAAYASPIVLVKKPDGSVRVCIDYRRLNKITLFDPEPIPCADEIFAKLSGKVYFSKFDLSKGYWQVKMRECDKDLTTFVTHKGLFRFRVMPFGLVNAPATFSRIMRKLLEGTRTLDNYLDDVLSHTKSWPEHISSLRELFERVRRAHLTLRPSKCEIGLKEVKFLGHRIGESGIKPSQDTVGRIVEAPRPGNKTQLRSFLGLVGFYRKFIPNFSAIAAPLTEMLGKRCPNNLLWEESQENAFVALKGYVVNPPVLMPPDFSKSFILQTDASDVGVGAILLQENDDDVKHPVAFASRKLLPRETRYSTIERECYAIVWGVQKFQEYLYGKTFLLETDHQPLQYLSKAQFQNGRLMRWALALQPYRFIIRAIKGSENVGADFLSRHVIDE